MGIAESTQCVLADLTEEGSTTIVWGGGCELLVEERHPDSTVFVISPERVAGSVSVVVSEDKVTEYTTGSFAPVFRGDLFVIAGAHTSLCTAFAACVAQRGSRLYLHRWNLEEGEWAFMLLNAHPDWGIIEHRIPLPEDAEQHERGVIWERIA